MKIQMNDLKKAAQSLYFELRSKGLSHTLAMAAVVESLTKMILDFGDVVEREEEEP